MSAFYDIELNAMSSVTLALLEDTGWYIGNYSIATKSTFGHGAGCDFVNDPCIVNGGEVPSSSRGFFCNSLSSLNSQSVQCTPTHKSLGYCDLFDLEEENIDQTFFPPAKFQYFNQDVRCDS